MANREPDDGPTPTPSGTPTRPRRIPPAAAAALGFLLLAPLIALALVPTYSSARPELWGFPFFYWYQLLWVIIASVCTYAAWRLICAVRGQKP